MASAISSGRFDFELLESSKPPRAIAAATGAYLNEDPLYLQTTGFVLAPDGTVVNAVYSSAAIGRLVPEDVVGLVSYIKSKA